ncbi:hypothetical protein DWU98_04365 [Dyella monticola]|uniref:Uncharacterized protein n=1 Tax=Dyella monticola TaxID=1927958 RepID=A0A370X5M6_9GAMM|nr:hypothetical protein [Dyella monticola]RDS83577.1 hypothetical protein DWU98_04365 [Dyella monticola]
MTTFLCGPVAYADNELTTDLSIKPHMTVYHRSKAANLEVILKQGGTHLFEITSDEMPELDFLPYGEKGIEMLCTYSARDTVWARIVNKMAAKNGSCLYERTRAGTYLVTCIVPTP